MCLLWVQVKLVVVDSVAFPFRMQQVAWQQQVVMLAALAQALRRVAAHGVAVVATNQVTGFSANAFDDVKPALGAQSPRLLACVCKDYECSACGGQGGGNGLHSTGTLVGQRSDGLATCQGSTLHEDLRNLLCQSSGRCPARVSHANTSIQAGCRGCVGV